MSKRRLPPALIIGSVLAALALGVGAFVLLSGGGVPLVDDLVGGDDSVPEFQFELGKVQAVATASSEDRSALQRAAEQAARGVRSTLTSVYLEAFLDPASWREDAYDGAYASFSTRAAVRARQDADVLTLGSGAGDRYETVLPVTGKLRVRVLMDRQGKPASAVALVRFTADATGTDGVVTEIVSSGQYFLEPVGGGWAVVGYVVDRNDRPRPQPGPTGTPSPEPS